MKGTPGGSITDSVDMLHYWRLLDQLSTDEATLLILGVAPFGNNECVDDWNVDLIPEGFYPIRAAIRDAVVAGTLKGGILRRATDVSWIEAPPASVVAKLRTDEMEVFFQVAPDWSATRVNVASLREWMKVRGIASSFFFPDEIASADYLNKDDPCFSPKLYAAIEAWKSVKRSHALGFNGSVKRALILWLTTQAKSFGLVKEDGKPNRQAIEDVAKIANWDMKGGAPKTPSKTYPPISATIQ